MTWDGDDLAGQAEDEEERKQELAEARQHKPRLTSDERARSIELESLRLSRSRVVSQLANATNPVHRNMLETALQAIEEKMRE